MSLFSAGLGSPGKPTYCTTAAGSWHHNSGRLIAHPDTSLVPQGGSGSTVGGCTDRQAGFSLLRTRLTEFATRNCKDLQRIIITLNEAHPERLDRNAVPYAFGNGSAPIAAGTHPGASAIHLFRRPASRGLPSGGQTAVQALQGTRLLSGRPIALKLDSILSRQFD